MHTCHTLVIKKSWLNQTYSKLYGHTNIVKKNASYHPCGKPVAEQNSPSDWQNSQWRASSGSETLSVRWAHRRIESRRASGEGRGRLRRVCLTGMRDAANCASYRASIECRIWIRRRIKSVSMGGRPVESKSSRSCSWKTQYAPRSSIIVNLVMKGILNR